MVALDESDDPLTLAGIAEAIGLESEDDTLTLAMIEMLYHFRAVQGERHDPQNGELVEIYYRATKSVDEVTQEFSVGVEFGVDDLGLYEIDPESDMEFPKDPNRANIHTERVNIDA